MIRTGTGPPTVGPVWQTEVLAAAVGHCTGVGQSGALPGNGDQSVEAAVAAARHVQLDSDAAVAVNLVDGLGVPVCKKREESFKKKKFYTQKCLPVQKMLLPTMARSKG